MKRDKPPYFLDAPATIHFAKISMLNLILEICNAYIAREVYMEIVERGGTHPDALIVKDAIKTGKLKVYGVRDKRFLRALLRHPEIHVGEAETITAARELRGLAVIDEKEARIIADLYKVKAYIRLRTPAFPPRRTPQPLSTSRTPAPFPSKDGFEEANTESSTW